MKLPNTREFDEYIIEKNGKTLKASYDQLQEYLDGHNPKYFVLCDSEYFRDFFDEIKNNSKCSFVTYLNNFIKENYNDNALPISKVSCFKKNSTNNDIEEVVSNFANIMNIPTSYIKQVSKYTPAEMLAYKQFIHSELEAGRIPKFEEYENFILSIDFVSKNEYFDSVTDYSGIRICFRGSSLKQWHTAFMNATLINPHTNEVLSREIKEELFRQFLPQFLFKTYVARDWDVKPENVGIIYDFVKKTYSIGPMFDFEFCFSNADEDISMLKFEDDLNYAFQYFPIETQKFLDAFDHMDINQSVDTYVDESTLLRPDDTDEPILAKPIILKSLRQFKDYLDVFDYMPQI